MFNKLSPAFNSLLLGIGISGEINEKYYRRHLVPPSQI